MKKQFKLPYCNTVHSVQGLSVYEEICIFDCNTPHVDHNFIWIAITRAGDLKNVIYFHHCKDQIKRLDETRKLQYLEIKINYYKIHDMDAKREFIKEYYIGVPWFTEAINNTDRCPLCGSSFYMVLDGDNNVMCNITCDRLDSNISHHKDNCHLMCQTCNCSKGKR